ncbi:MAG: hypothetical protein ACKV2U_32520 [Bryobacteraceae bacterium]
MVQPVVATPVPGFTIKVDSSRSAIVKRSIGGAHCGESRGRITEFEWAIEGPAGSATQIRDPKLPGIEFVPDRPGSYTVGFTACPKSCAVSVISGFTPTNTPIRTVEEIGPETRSVTVQVLDTFQIPPQFAPPRLPSARVSGSTSLVPATAPQDYQRQRDLCKGRVGIHILQGPNWLTTAFNTPQLQLAEGIVYLSEISSVDDIRNHEKMDAIAEMELDPPYRNLLVRGINSEDAPPTRPFGGLEVEWEYDLWKEAMRPLIGDRMSALGYHIVDCDHDGIGEIHPPIAVAVHRQRAIKLPATLPQAFGNPPFPDIGQGVIVPGIITDIWANLDGGQALDCDSNGLAIPLDPPIEVPQPAGRPPIKKFTNCAHQPDPPAAPFVFHIFLPPSPRQLLAEVGVVKTIDAPLYVSIENHPEQSHLKARGDLLVTIIERVIDGPMPYLKVRVDLSRLPKGGRFAKRIVAAWVYPDLTRGNYGVRSLSVKLNSLAVKSDSEPGFDDGDWRLWVSLPSISQPWTQLLDCEGCVDDDKTYTPTSSLWKAGALGRGGVIARDVMLFRSQRALVTTSGFEEDIIWNDSIGNGGSASFASGTTSVRSVEDLKIGSLTLKREIYVATFEAVANAPLPQAIISPRLAQHTERLKIGVTPAIQTRLDVLSPRAIELDRLRNDWARESAARKRNVYPRGLLFSRTGMSTAISNSKPEDQNAFVAAIRKHALRRLGPNPDAPKRERVARELRELKDLIPAPLYKRHLCEIETGKPCP